MRCVDDRKGRIGKQYFCASYSDSLAGRGNPHGCRRHAVDHSLVEEVVTRYLKEKHEGYTLLASGTQDEAALGYLISGSKRLYSNRSLAEQAGFPGNCCIRRSQDTV